MVEDKHFEVLLAALGAVLAEVRQEKGLSQVGLAASLGKQQSAVAKMESPSGRSIGLKVLLEWASHLDLRLSELFARAEKRAGLAPREAAVSQVVGSKLEPAQIADLLDREFNLAKRKILRQLTTFDKVD